MFDLMVYAVLLFGFPLGILGVAFRRNGGLGIWPSEEGPEPDSSQGRQVPIPLLEFHRREGATLRP
jgi:hypothetical protein